MVGILSVSHIETGVHTVLRKTIDARQGINDSNPLMTGLEVEGLACLRSNSIVIGVDLIIRGRLSIGIKPWIAICPRWDHRSVSRTRTDEAAPLGLDQGFPTPRMDVHHEVEVDTADTHHTHHTHEDGHGIP